MAVVLLLRRELGVALEEVELIGDETEDSSDMMSGTSPENPRGVSKIETQTSGTGSGRSENVMSRRCLQDENLKELEPGAQKD